MVFILVFLLVLGVWFLINSFASKHFSFSVNIKINRYVLIPSAIVFLAVCSLLYLKYDTQKYYYGLGCNFCGKNMPFSLTPNKDRYSSFTLIDDVGFEIVGTGFRHKKSSFKIKDFLGYGYNDTSVVLRCTDSLDNIRYLMSCETGYKSNKGAPSVSFKDIEQGEIERIKDNYDWIILDESKANSIAFKGFMCLLGIVLSFFFMAKFLIKLKKRKKP